MTNYLLRRLMVPPYLREQWPYLVRYLEDG